MEVYVLNPAADSTVRERLILSAAHLFTQKGYAATTVREIVAAAGVTKPVLYYYFRNKEGIYLELIQEPFEKFSVLLDSFRAERGSASERIVRLSDQLFALFLENLEAARLMYSIYYGPPQGAPFFDFETYHLKFQEAFRDLIQEGIRGGELQKGNVQDMAWIILGAVTVAMEAQISHPETGIDRQQLARILNLILKGLSGGQARTKARKA